MGNAKYAATRMTVSIGVAVLVVLATVVPTASASSSDVPPPDKTALIMGGTTVPTPDDYYVETVGNHFIAPTHPRQKINYVAVTAPMEAWPLTGIGRLGWLVLGPPSVWGPGGAGWPDEPWWKLSGLFDLTFEQSILAGVADLEQAMTKYGNDDLVIYGYSQGALIAIREKQRLAEQYPDKSTAPDVDFVLSGDLNVPNGGLLARFPGLYIPIIDLFFNGPEPTDTPFDTVVITRQYDGVADFPLYPLNVISLLNAVLGAVYVHPYDLDVSLAPDPSKSTPFQDTHGDTTYYFFKTPDLPLFAPLRTLGVPESWIDVVEPFFKVMVELGYDRTIPAWEPTPARLFPQLDPTKVVNDLVNAVGEGINNAAALVGLSPPISSPARALVASLEPADAAPNLKKTRISAKATTNDAAVQPNPPEPTAPAGAKLPALTAPVAQQNPVASSPAAGNESRLRVKPRLKPSGRPVTHRPVSQPTHNVAAPHDRGRTTASNGDGEPKTGSVPSPTPAGSSPTAGPSGTNSPGGTNS
jgi:hypothetical protein